MTAIQNAPALLIWADGNTRSIPMGSRFRGIAHKGKRPVAIVFTRDALISLMNAQYTKEYIQEIIAALAATAVIPAVPQTPTNPDGPQST